MTTQRSKTKSKSKKKMKVLLIGRKKSCQACHEGDAYFRKHKSRFRYKYIDVDSQAGQGYVKARSITIIPHIIATLPDGITREERGWDQNDWE